MLGPWIGWKSGSKLLFFLKKPVLIGLQVKWQEVGRDASWETICVQRLARGNI